MDKKQYWCQICGGECIELEHGILLCKDCQKKHFICPGCDGNCFKINYSTNSIFEVVEDCSECNGMGTKLIEFKK